MSKRKINSKGTDNQLGGLFEMLFIQQEVQRDVWIRLGHRFLKNMPKGKVGVSDSFGIARL